MEEIWKKVRGFEEYAEISNMGQIHRFEKVIYCGRNHQSKRIQEESWTYGGENGKGYLTATIGNVNKGVHVWVYETFYNCDIPKGMEVNHLDENKHNNRLDNLNLMSHGDNMRYGTGNARRSDALKGKPKSTEHIEKISVALKTSEKAKIARAKVAEARRGVYNTKNSKTVQALDKITGEVVMEFPSTMEAGRQGFNQGHISDCCRNCYKRPGNNIYKGLIWQFAI